MKTKILKSKGWWRLVVQDKDVNEAHGYSNQKPIVLGVINHFFDSGCWSVQDYRLKKYLNPSAYLEEGTMFYKIKNEKEKAIIKKLLHTFTLKENIVQWSRFDSFAFDGDIPDHTDKNGHIQSSVARFTFKEALKRFQAQKEFWDIYDGDLLCDKVRIPNLYRQMHDIELFSNMEKKLVKKKKIGP